MTEQRSYKIDEFSTNVDVEIERLKAQVELFWDVEKRNYEDHGLRDGLKLLDCGSGPGCLVLKLARNYPACSIHSLEIDPILLGHQRDYLARNGVTDVEFHEGSINDNSLPENYFDIIISRLVLEHLPDPVGALKNLRRLLNDGGRLIIVDNDFDYHLRTCPEIPELETMYRAYCRLRIDEGGNPRIGRELPVLFKKAGLADIRFGLFAAHSSFGSDSLFLKSESAGISAVLMKKGYLSEKDFDNLTVNWSRMVQSKDHMFIRQLFICSGQKGEDEVPEETAVERPEAAGSEERVEAAMLKGLGPQERSDFIRNYLYELIVSALELPDGTAIADDESLIGLGLDSLRGVMMREKIKNGLGIEIGIARLLKADSIAMITDALMELLGGDSPAGPVEHGDAAPAAQPVENDHESMVFPLSYNQQSLWFLHSLYPDSAAYNVAVAFRILSGIDRDALQYAFNGVVRGHEALRTSYRMTPGQAVPEQRINAFREISVEYRDAGGLSGKELDRQVREFYERPFNLETGPAVRLGAFRINENESVLLFVLHHIACDAYSLRILMESFFDHYGFFHEGKPDDRRTPRPGGSYADYVRRQKDILDDKTKKEEYLSFWRNQLENMPREIGLPRDFERPPVMVLNGSSCYFTIGGGQYKDLAALSRSCRVSLNAVLAALFQALLFAITGQDDLVYGMLSTGRSAEEDRDTCGYFINPLVMRARRTDDMPFADYVSFVYDRVLEVLERREFPFTALVEELAVERDSAKMPLFQVLFNYLNTQSLGVIADLLIHSTDNGPLEIAGFPVSPYPLRQQEGQFELTFEVVDNGAMLFCNLKHNTDLFTGSTAARICSSFRVLLERVLADPRAGLGGLVEKSSAEFREETKKHGIHDIVVAANYTIELVADPLNFWLEKLSLNYRLKFAPYNQVFQQLLDPGSRFRSNASGVNVICLRLEEWLPREEGSRGLTDAMINKFGEIKKEFTDAIRLYNGAGPITTLVLFSPASPEAAAEPAIGDLLAKAEDELCNELNAANGVYAWKAGDVASLYPVAEYYEKMGEAIGHIPYTRLYFTALGTFLARKIFALHQRPYKVIVLDCDNTLWNGVVGEDGVAGLAIDDEKKAFQRFLVGQYDAGMVLCLCSKNNPKDVFDVFEKHPDMILKKDHITASRINWSLKSENIIDLARELNLGLDSFIFIDDNPVECSEAEIRCPGLLALRLPEKGIMKLMDHVWSFDKLKVTRDDRIRADFYRSDIKRSRLQGETYSFADFIDKLELKIGINELRDDEIGRASQMTKRVNQFNLKTIRRDEGAVMKLARDPSFRAYSVYVRDRFADYGLVGSMAFELRKGRIVLDTFLLSCRALGKGVEHAMLARIGQFGLDNNIDEIEIEYIPSERNTPIANFLEKNLKEYGSPRDGNTLYVLPARIASEVRFNTDEKMEKIEESGGEKKKGDTRPAAFIDNEQMIEIANDCSDIGKIINEIATKAKGRKGTAAATKPATAAVSLSGMEKALTIIWKDLLYHDNFSIDNNFFEIGGKSILIPSIVIRLKKDHGVDISIVDVFTYPTIRSLAGFIAGAAPRADEKKNAIDAGGQRQALNARIMRMRQARGLVNQE